MYVCIYIYTLNFPLWCDEGAGHLKIEIKVRGGKRPVAFGTQVLNPATPRGNSSRKL